MTNNASTSAEKISLCPTQQNAFQWFTQGVARGRLFELACDNGMGRTTLLQHLHAQLGGTLLSAKTWVDNVLQGHPLALEDAFYRGVMEALEQHDLVLVDDVQLLTAATSQCHFNPRAGYVQSPLTVITAYAEETKKTLIMGTDGHAPESFQARRYYCGMQGFKAADYRHVCQHWLGEPAAAINFEKVYRFAPKLNGHQLRS